MSDYKQIYPIDECIYSIQHSVDVMRIKIDHLELENKALRDEHFKDKELSRQKQEIETLQHEARIGFRMTEYESDMINKWICNHEKNHKDCGRDDGRYIYEFTPTTIGCVGVVKCTCGEAFCFRSLD